MSENLNVSQRGGVATICLHRPEKRNALSLVMWEALARACSTLERDAAVRVLVVRGAGGNFSAGADITTVGDATSDEFTSANQAAENALAHFSRPSIALVEGYCVGGGCQIALACDLRIGSARSRYGITPARLGLIYPASAVERLVAAVGPSSAKHLLFSAELIDADRALRIGLINEVHADPEIRVAELARLLATQRSALTLGASKEMVDAAAAGGVSAELRERWRERSQDSPDRAEGVSAFLQKRSPEFS